MFSVVRNWNMFCLWSPCSCITFPISGSFTIVPLQQNSFLQKRNIFFRFRSDANPCTVVNVLRPFLCWIRMWTKFVFVMLPPCRPSPSVSAKGSARKNSCQWNQPYNQNQHKKETQTNNTKKQHNKEHNKIGTKRNKKKQQRISL